MLVAVIIFIPHLSVIAKALAIITFILLTSPVAAHVLGRTGYFVGVPLWEGTVRDDLQGHYNPLTHELISGIEDELDEGKQDALPDEEPSEDASMKKKMNSSSKTHDSLVESPDLVDG
jgi:multicomponent Na+:H+ antiporter subunit G